MSWTLLLGTSGCDCCLRCRKNPDNQAPVFIVRLAPTGPAFLDGTLEKGDELLAVDDVPCQGATLLGVTDLLVGAQGSLVKLTAKHAGECTRNFPTFVVRGVALLR